jgi:hypothetical protein
MVRDDPPSGQPQEAAYDWPIPIDRLSMALHPTRRRGESVRGLVYGTLLGILIWLALGLLLLALL